MAYIGKQPVVGNFQVCDAISVVNGQAAYTMQVNSTNVEPENANHMLVSLNGILQKPGSSFTISGATITFASNLATGDVIDFIILLGDTLNVGTPSDDSVGAAQTKNDIISGQTALTSTPDDTDEFLVSDAGTIKRIDYSLIKGGGITQADGYRLSADANSGTGATVSSNWERIDDASFGRIGSGVTQSSGIFSFPETGIYQVFYQGRIQQNGSDAVCNLVASVTQNNSDYDEVAIVRMENPGEEESGLATMFLVDVTDTSNVKFLLKTTSFSSGTVLRGDTDYTFTGVFVIRLGDT